MMDKSCVGTRCPVALWQLASARRSGKQIDNEPPRMASLEGPEKSLSNGMVFFPGLYCKFQNIAFTSIETVFIVLVSINQLSTCHCASAVIRISI